MDPDSVMQVAIPLVGIVSGWSIGRRGLSRQTIDLLRIRIETVTEENEEKKLELTELKTRVEVLEGLVTQRAAVEEVRNIVERIADRVGA
jgi:regulator of replication initiation timing